MQLLQEALTLRSDERERESLFLRHEQDGVCPGLTVTQLFTNPRPLPYPNSSQMVQAAGRDHAVPSLAKAGIAPAASAAVPVTD